MTVDVVMVNYHSRHVLPTSVRAAREFIGDDARFVFVDNSPGDGAQNAMAEAAPGSTVIENSSNVGFAAAVNQGIEAGTGEIVLLLNPDIASISGDLSEIEQTFAENARVAAVAVQLLDPDGAIQRHVRGEPDLLDWIAQAPGIFHRVRGAERIKRFTMSDWDHRSRREVDTARGACLWIRRAALEDVGLFDERFFFYSEETDWLVRAKARGWKTVFLPSIEAVHATRTSTDADWDDLDYLLLESQHKYARKHFGLTGSFVLRGSFILFDSLRWLRSLPGTEHAGRRRDLARRLSIHLGRGQSGASGRDRPDLRSDDRPSDLRAGSHGRTGQDD
jgi:N-acetylglucosaminyl-diphospho-decaprenol L-rhamnosyltransferase